MKKNKQSAKKNPRYRIITAERPSCYAAEAYRRIKVCIDSLSIDTTNQIIQICSALPSDGKSTTLLNMAVSYAENGKKVLVMDMDLRKPKIHKAFNVENAEGLTSYLADNNAVITSYINHSNYKGIDFINAGPAPVRPSIFLSLERLNATMQELRKMYDVILIDEPPILVSPDCCIIAKFCDAAVFQISRKNTEISAAKQAVKILRQNGVNLLGCVFTEMETDSDTYTYNYKYRY